ncbi:MAG TPA: ABC transporter ATP-binding protein [Candidatus Acidoferrales bacterium]|nr:ABC transporter ATP-binding protein [Candidatus Acidoferrales bacterium]
MDPVVQFRNVSKRYRLRRGWYPSLRDHAAALARRAKNWLARNGAEETDEIFWALRDVSFEVEEGESVGIIGANGAGKSTILKILSRVTAPTSGSVSVDGKIGALIEVGAGFHPELSGRENVFLSGSIMGMKRREIERRFESIVEFAGVGEFIDTPVKFYSSGMYIRLGFAIAAHLDPDILLIDEILAVGDAAFQVKCLNKIAELKASGKTTILVSHELSNIRNYTQKAIWLTRGQIAAVGDPDEIVDRYLQSLAIQRPGASSQRRLDSAQKPIQITQVRLLDGNDRARDLFCAGEDATVEIRYDLAAPVASPVFTVSFKDVQGPHVGSVATSLDGFDLGRVTEPGILRFKLSPVLFMKGAYVVSLSIRERDTGKIVDLFPNAVTLVVGGPNIPPNAASGHFIFPHTWETADDLPAGGVATAAGRAG